MKKILFIFITIVGIVTLFSCEKELRDPKLDLSQTVVSGITQPASGTAFVLTSADVDNLMTTFKWTETVLNLSNLEPLNYTLEMDVVGSDFSNPYELVTTDTTSYAITVGEMNAIMLKLEYPADEAQTLEFRVRSFITDVPATETVTEIITLSITPFVDVVTVTPIYLLGDATPVEWDNLLALEMAPIGEGRFARVEYLDPGIGDWFKFIADLGAWAPQWGTDETGITEAGPLIYRPTEDDPDPVAIPAPLEAGNYYIEVDTAELTYKTFLSMGNLFLVGEATTVGWDAAAALPFDEVEPHIFEITTTLGAGGMKFLEIQGEWAPQWGTNELGTGEGGPLIFRPDEVTQDPAEVPSPGAGTYKITVDLTKITYTIVPQ